MKSKIAAALFALCLLGAAALAEDYSIRINWNTNLRTGPGLKETVFEIAPAAAILHVTGSQGDWLQISRNGKQLWLADWVGYTRLENSQTGPSGIDNCCFINRQCSSDQEWVNGFWAYKNKQCEHPGIVIEGSEDFITAIQEALDLLRERAPAWHAYVDQGLDKIKAVTEAYGTGVWVHYRTFNISPKHVDAGPVWLAGIIVHEACHVRQFEAGQIYYGLEAERACLEIQLDLLTIINPDDSFQFGLPVLLENIENPQYQWWH